MVQTCGVIQKLVSLVFTSQHRHTLKTVDLDMTGDDNNTDAGDDSDKSFAITTSSLMDGLNVGFGYG
jgi:hypothetical protein